MKVNTELNMVGLEKPRSTPGQQLERAFLAEMLKYAGPKPSEGSFSGGIGEEQFASFLTESYADKLSESLDLGLFDKLQDLQ